jgi:Rap1a immunity proteins
MRQGPFPALMRISAKRRLSAATGRPRSGGSRRAAGGVLESLAGKFGIWLAIGAMVLITLISESQGQTEENRGSAGYALPLCKTWLDFAEKEPETVQKMGRTEPVRLTAAGVCVGFVIGVLEALRSAKLSCPPRDISNPQLVRTVLSEIEKHPKQMQQDFVGPVRAAMIKSWPCPKKKGPHRIGSRKR